MAPIYETSDEMKEIVELLIRKRGDIFGHVNPDMIICGLRIDKPAPAKQKDILKIEGIRGAKTLLSDKKYLIHGYSSRWERISREKKLAHIANMLKRIAFPTPDELSKLAKKGEDYEYGKIEKPDITDWRSFIQELGVDWADDQKEIPNIAENTTVIL